MARVFAACHFHLFHCDFCVYLGSLHLIACLWEDVCMLCGFRMYVFASYIRPRLRISLWLLQNLLARSDMCVYTCEFLFVHVFEAVCLFFLCTRVYFAIRDASRITSHIQAFNTNKKGDGLWTHYLHKCTCHHPMWPFIKVWYSKLKWYSNYMIY